jgi:hypothetical protein
MKRSAVPVIVGATGIVTKGIKNYLKAIRGEHSIHSLPDTPVLKISPITRKVLQS